jgi:hypothetical protein
MNYCYDESASISVSVMKIAPGQVHEPGTDLYGLKAQMDTGTCCGEYVVRYDVFDVNNTSDICSLTITYHVSGDACSVGIKEQTVMATMNAITPNPAAETTSLTYTIQSAYHKASIKLYTLTGSLLKEVELKENKGKVILDVTAIPAGVYFYTLQVDEKPIHTNKLLVSH